MIKESDLYHPIAAHFEQLGYAVHAEVLHSDIVAVKDGEMLTIELKTTFNLKLLYQAIDRQHHSDYVYIAVPHTVAKSKDYKEIKALTKRLFLGLILVNVEAATADIIIEPQNYSKRAAKTKQREAVTREINGRSQNVNIGGIAGKERMTAYKERALQIASLIDKHGFMSVKDIKAQGITKCATILRKNYNGYFVSYVEGQYMLTREGKLALSRYSQLLEKSDEAQEI